MQCKLTRIRLLVSNITVALCWSAGAISAADLPEIDIPTIQAALDEYRSGFQTLVGSYQRQTTSYTKLRAGHERENQRWEVDFRVDFQRDWTSRSRTRIWFFSAISTTEPFSLFEQLTFDGAYTYYLKHSLGTIPATLEVDPEILDVPRSLSITQWNQERDEFYPWISAGLTRRFGGPGLAERLKEHESHLTGVEPIDGAPCYVVAIGDFLKVALDPALRFVPRRMHYLTPETREFETYENLEFQQFSDAETGEEWWFPSHSRWLTPTDRTEFHIVKLSRNQALTQADFRIDPETLPDGVAVTRQHGGKPPEIFVTGNRDDLWELRNQKLNALERDIESRLPPVQPSDREFPDDEPLPPQGIPDSLEEVSPIVSLSLVCLAILGFWWLRWRRRSS